jgi:coenzyme F420-reducing hydrogenase alpha subunit
VPIEGEIHVAVPWDGSGIGCADVRSTRPFVAPRLLVGKTLAEACALVPLLFSICGRSQAIAAAAACEAATGTPAEPRTVDARALLVAGEAMQEYAFRALIDWPRLRGEEPAAKAVADVRRRVGDALAPLALATGANPLAPDADACERAARSVQETATEASARLLGEPAAAWLARSPDDGVETWARSRATPAARLVADVLDADPRFGASDVALLPASGHEQVVRTIAGAMDADAAFERAPRWEGRPAETGALARRSREPIVAALVAKWGGSVATRLAARVAEMAALALSKMNVNHGQATLGSGEGIGWVETARGLLVHRARVERGRIAGYRIVAPTEWNFHPDGALARGLRGARFADAAAAERGTRLLLQALDPCVAARIEVTHA